MISKETAKTILAASDLFEVAADFYTLKKTGKSYHTECPKCGKAKGLKITPSEDIFKCFSCDFGGKGSASFLIETQGMKYPHALKYLADKFNVIIDEAPKPKGPQKKTDKRPDTFRDRQLRSSGLTNEDQLTTLVIDENTVKMVDSFEAGTRDQYGKIVPGDDLLIWYYDLYGKPVMYQKPKSTKEEHLCRVRWQNPDMHKDQHGRSMKYSSPYGSGSHLFIPDVVRKIYQDRRVIKRLYIQEGEKKAMKACKHGLPSVGIMGIQNLGHQGKLPHELMLIVQACGVEEVVFMLDGDWDHLSNNLLPGARVDLRPFSFYYAVKNFREYFKTFISMNIYLEIYFGYILPNERKDKGIDDLLTGTLFAKEMSLYDDISKAINQKDGKGEYVHLHKITVTTDSKLLEFWGLQSADIFANKYKDDLASLPEFIIGKHKWRFNADGKLEPAQALQEDETYYQEVVKTDRMGNSYSQYHFRNTYCYNFLRRRGFGRLMMYNRQYKFCQIENKTVRIVEPYQIRDYMMEFSRATLTGESRVEVLDFLYRGGKMYFGPDSLSNLDFVNPVFESADKNFQYMYFKDKYWKITADGIEENPLINIENYLWADQVINFDAKLIKKDLVSVIKLDENLINTNKSIHQDYYEFLGSYLLELSQEAKESHFISFLWNTGEFFWRKIYDPITRQFIEDNRDIAERFETQLHFVSKMTAIGYLLHEARDKSCEKAVIAMDGKLSEVGDSNGRSGKSLLGYALEKLTPQVYISGKSKELTEDPFLFEEVTEQTNTIFIDDVRPNVDFEFFFPIITGRLTINCKGIGKHTLPEKETPKLYITTNHAINGSTSSFRDRQALIAFSDFYGDDWKPVDDFGCNFFDEWDEKQWNLFYNFIAACLQLYFKAQKLGWGTNKSGIISPPYDRLDKRRLRQEAGEVFISWADEYYEVSDDDNCSTIDTPRLNFKIERKEMYNDFLDRNPSQRKFYTANIFLKKLIAYSRYRGFKINPQMPVGFNGRPGHDKSGGIEFLTMANEKFSITQG